MAFTPTDPTKAEVRVTGTGPAYGFDFYIPRGAKGEPGGFANAAGMGSGNIDALVTPGLYAQTSGAHVTTANGYPLTLSNQVLMQVFHSQLDNSRIEQRLTYMSSTGAASRAEYRRSMYGGTISPWRAFSSQRVDQSAGRAIYTWDDVNQREQLIYGDTGRRGMTVPEVTGGLLYLRRVDTTVFFVAVGAVMANGTPSMPGFIPPGFRPYANSYYQYREGSADPARAVIAFSNGELQFRGVQNGPGGVSAVCSWDTLDPWPTTLPGVASGSIPNL